MIMWEVFHNNVPFDGDLQAATDIVLKDDARPLINADIEVGKSDVEIDTERDTVANRNSV